MREHLPDLRALEIFVGVADTGSMTAAARRLGLTQSAVSQATRQLERDLNAALIDRQGRPLRPTAAGAALLRHARRLLDDARRLPSTIAIASDAALPQLRVGLVDSFAVTVGPDLIRGLSSEAEEVRVWSGLSRQLAAGLLERELDVLVSADSLDALSEVECERIFREPFVLALPGGLAAPGTVPELRQLARDLPLVRYSARSVTGQQVDRHLRWLRVEAARRLEFDGSESVVAMVASGIGWAVTSPLCLLQGRADFERLTLAPIPGGTPMRDLYLVHRRGEHAAPVRRVRSLACRHLRSTIREQVRPFVPWAASDVRVG